MILLILYSINVPTDFSKSLNWGSPALISFYAYNLPFTDPTHFHKFTDYIFTYNKRKKTSLSYRLQMNY